MTNTKRNTGPPSTMAVLLDRRVMTNLTAKVVGTASIELEEVRGELMADSKSHIKILRDIPPPPITNLI